MKTVKEPSDMKFLKGFTNSAFYELKVNDYVVYLGMHVGICQQAFLGIMLDHRSTDTLTEIKKKNFLGLWDTRIA